MKLEVRRENAEDVAGIRGVLLDAFGQSFILQVGQLRSAASACLSLKPQPLRRHLCV